MIKNKLKRENSLDFSDRKTILRYDFFNIEEVENVIDCLFVSQLFYWFLIMKGCEFYKTDKELSDELSISVRQIQLIKIKLLKSACLNISCRGLPRRTFYSFNINELQKILQSNELLTILSNLAENIQFEQNRQTSIDKTGKLVSTKPVNKYRQNRQTSIDKTGNTYIEHKITTEITTNNPLPPLSTSPNSESSNDSLSSDFLKNERLTNAELDLKAQEFLDIAAFDDLKPSEDQRTRVMFKTRLQVLLRQHDKTLDDFMGAARYFYVEGRPNEKIYVTRPHNFIERTVHGNKETPWLDYVAKQKVKKITRTREEAFKLIDEGKL